jgi:putative endonuclease
MKQYNFSKGRQGEEKAREYLENIGYILVAQNYENKIGEIDLVMRDKDWLVFVEVKYKLDDLFGRPEEMIDKRKIYQIKRVAESYVFLEKPKEIKYRIDAVCILGNEIKHYQNL